jgi:uncharacterized protein YjbI with pentapeptide repeats
MKFRTLTTVATLLCFGLSGQAQAENQQDLLQLKNTGDCTRCDLSGVKLNQASLTGVILRDANLKGVDFTGANLQGADLTGANLEGAILNNANLTGASLTGATLKSASFENANLNFASMMGANLEGTNFKGSKQEMTNFRGAYFRLTTTSANVVTSDKPYGWSLQRDIKRDCNKFKVEGASGSVCATDQAPGSSTQPSQQVKN